MGSEGHHTNDLAQLPRHQKRAFIPEDLDLTDVAVVTRLYQELLLAPVDSADSFERWIRWRSELDAAVDEVGSISYIRMTCQTDDAARVAAYQHFIEKVSPAIKPLAFKLSERYLLLVKKFPIASEYAVYTRNIAAEVTLFREENIPLQVEVEKWSQQYQACIGSMTVEFQGKERTLPEMSLFLLETNRDTRYQAWRSTAERRVKDTDSLEGLFDQLCVTRNTIARNAGCKNFIDYCFTALHRFDYTPADCKRYHAVIEKTVVPVWGKMLLARKKMMGLSTLRPWDTAVDPLGRPPLKPFDGVATLVSGCRKIFSQMDASLAGCFDVLATGPLLDLASRKGKAPGGYQSTLSESRKPFIFMNAVGTDDDVRTLLHESGHAFHSLLAAHEPLYSYRHAPMEFCEVASMSMELLAGEYLSAFYDEEQWRRSRVEHLEGCVSILVWVAIVDAFQYWIYEHPGHTRDERTRAWRAVCQRFDTGLIDWSGYEEFFDHLWHRQLHIFEVPLYYIEYGIAQLGALQLWAESKKDFPAALLRYRQALALGGSRPLPELFATAGIRFDFSQETITPVVAGVEREWQGLIL